MSKKFDFIILGSGSAAFAAAIKASELGAKVAMTEHDTIGGACVNRGCIPSKNLIAAAEMAYHALHSPFAGLRCKGFELDFAQLIHQKDVLVEELRTKKYINIVESDRSIEIVKGRARFIKDTAVEVGEATLSAEKFLIATGTRPFIPPIEGLQDAGYITSRQAFELTELPKSLLIVGGGYIAMELSQMFSRFGAKVTVLGRSPFVLRGFEKDISIALQSYLEEEGVHIVTEAQAVKAKKENGEIVVTAEVKGELRDFTGQQLLIATGRTPNTEDIGLEQVGVELDGRGFVKVDSFMRTNLPNIWAAGDATGGQLATPVGAREGVIAAGNAIEGLQKQMDYRTIPRAVFTDPEVGAVGLTEEEAENQGYDCRCQVLDLSLVPKAAAIRNTKGLVKMVIDKESQKILGVHLITPRGADIIHEAALAVKFGLTINNLIDAIHIYPTMSEALRMTAQTFFKDVSRLSCCAE